jgi:hypothetical protein
MQLKAHTNSVIQSDAFHISYTFNLTILRSDITLNTKNEYILILLEDFDVRRRNCCTDSRHLFFVFSVNSLKMRFCHECERRFF